MAALKEVIVPDIGDFKDVEVIEVLVHPGEEITQEQSIITLETDKATMEIPSPAKGVVKELSIKRGDKVSKGSLILKLEEPSAAAAEAPRAEPAPADNKAPAPAAPAPAAQPAAGNAAPAADDSSEDSEAAAKADSSTEPRSVSVPDIGDFKDVEVIEILVKPGDRVKKEQSLVTLESDKATMEIPSPDDGVVAELVVKPGDKVSRGAPILLLRTAGGSSAAAGTDPQAAKSQATPAPSQSAAAPAAAKSAALSLAPQPPAPALEAAPAQDAPRPHASPSIRKFARELGVALEQVNGSGPKGRILHEDVQHYVKQTLAAPAARLPGGKGGLVLDLPAWPEIDFSAFGPVETVPLSRIQKISGPVLARNWIAAPHVTQFDEADITELEAFRKAQGAEAQKQGVKLTLLAFLIKACVAALKAYPQFNASLTPSRDALILKKYFHIGVAVDTPDGLLVPVLRDADRKGILEIARELADLSKQTRERKIKPSDLQGGTFSISSLGGLGGSAFTPIINAPEVAILGVSRASMRPVWNGREFVPRLVLPLSLSYDHRVVDGAAGARFTTYLSSVLADLRRSLL